MSLVSKVRTNAPPALRCPLFPVFVIYKCPQFKQDLAVTTAEPVPALTHVNSRSSAAAVGEAD